MTALTMDTLREAMKRLAEIPSPPIFASCSLFPSDAASEWTERGQKYLIAGPALWDKIPAAPATDASSVLTLTIHDLDHPSEGALRQQVLLSYARNVTGYDENGEQTP